MRLLLSILILGLLNPVAALAGCAPEKMVKIIVRVTTPGYEEGHVATMPKTLYRLGSHHARVEDPHDREHGVHGLIVVNGRDTWMINLAVKTGRHIVDSAENYDFHAPIIGGANSPFAGFEFGCELAYMDQRGVEPARVRIDDQDLLQYDATEKGMTVRLLVDPKTGKPWGVRVIQDGKAVHQLHYDEYLTGLEPDMALFTRPDGISYEEAKQQS